MGESDDITLAESHTPPGGGPREGAALAGMHLPQRISMKNSEKNMEFLDLKDASEELGLSHHQLVKEVLKKGCGLYIRFDDESKRKGELVFENHPSSVYEIQPGRIHKLTPDSTRRVMRMLEKETINFQGLRLEIKTDALVFIVKITQEDEGMHLVVLKTELLKEIPLLGLNNPEIKQNVEVNKIDQTIVPITSDSLIKLKAPIGLKKLKELFISLEEQGMVSKGSSKLIEEHFTESAMKKTVSDEVKPIVWESKKYEAVKLLLTLRNAYWIEASDKDLSKHFIYKNKPLSITNHNIKTTDKLDHLEEILSSHKV